MGEKGDNKMFMGSASRLALFTAVSAMIYGGAPAIAENAIKAPAQKSIGTGKQETRTVPYRDEC